MTKIGIISDTHDNQIAIREAIKVFDEQNVSIIFHCGDFIAPFSVKKLLEYPLRMVFGNNDGEKRIIRRMASNEKNCLLEEVILIEEIEGKKIAMTHGHYNNILESALYSCSYDIVLSGHNHERMSETLPNGTLHVNPGEGGGWLKGSASVAVLDLESMNTTFFDIWHYDK
ncbi:MAG: metallophosphoesterase [Candidatus Hodarchaeota archaeon]